MKKLAHCLAERTFKPALYVLLLAALAACAPIPEAPEGVSQDQANEMVFPPPPEEARFHLERVLMSSADVVEEAEESSFRRTLTGAARSGEGLTKPYGVAVFQGRVFVSDSGSRSIKVFDLPGRRFYRIGEGDDLDREGLSLPLGLDIDRFGNVYVVDAAAKVVKVYTKDGKFLRKLGGPEWFNRPASVTVDKGGDRIYVVDIGGTSSNEHHRIRVFDARTGVHLRDISKRGSADGEVNLPRDAQISPKDGLLYVMDSGNFRVQAFDLDGKFVRAFGSIGLQMGQFSRPKELAIDAAGNIYVVDAAFGNVQIFTAEGQLLLPLGSRSPYNRGGKYMLPSGVAVDEDGRVYVVDQYFRRVDVYRPAALAPDTGFAVLGGVKPAAPK
jgi:DNA-binding beta-propeller fold protein YncE